MLEKKKRKTNFHQYNFTSSNHYTFCQPNPQFEYFLLSAFHALIEEQSPPVQYLIVAVYNINKGETASPGSTKAVAAICSANVRSDDAIFSQIRRQS